MSFELTHQEQTRVELALLGGIKLDPIGHGDLVVIVILSLTYFLNFIAVGYLIWNRNYPPLKSKYPFLMSSCFLAMFIWFLGDIVLKSHIHVRGPLFSNCMLFCVWLRVVFGAFMISALISIRSYALLCIFICNRAYRGKYVYCSSGLVILLGLIFIIITYTLPQSKTVHYVPLIEMCDMSYTYRAIVQGLLWFTWIINAAINYKLRNINSSFNESREMFVACVSVFLLLAFNTIILYAYPLYPTQARLRISETLLSHSLPNFLWWFIMFKSMYNCAFRREKYLAEWKDKLVRDGLQKQYQISRTDPFSVTMVSVDSNVAKLVTLPRGMVTDHDGFDARTSFSQHSAAHSYDDDRTAARNRSDEETGGTGLWKPESANRHPRIPGAEEHLHNSSDFLFSPQHISDRPLENSSSTSTVNEQSAQLSQYNFPIPPKST
ncbi:hypothetical protein H4R24_004626 [Coemansia sp. RSA 988]|nr:hypothetical protein H4R24_004626 [Coemansia sp. RSA 988]